MKKKDYELIADSIKLWGEYDNNNVSSGIGHDLAEKFAKDNPKFDRYKFLQACGIEDGFQKFWNSPEMVAAKAKRATQD